MSDRIEIKIADNGIAIPFDLVNKVFQSFFTTKPAGAGTGLGLSLAYDIVKAHGGELRINTEFGEGAEFIVQLPCKNEVIFTLLSTPTMRKLIKSPD